MYEFISSPLINMKLCLVFVCALLPFTEAKVHHKDIFLCLCSDTFGEQIYGLDGEEMWHADFDLKKGVMTLPQFADPYSYVEGAYENALAQIDNCKTNLATAVKAYNYPAEPQITPRVLIYSRDKVELGSKNTLICYISGFYPAHVGVSWTKNNENVTDEASLSRYYVTDDGTFNLVSRLSFTPKEGDIYTCTVEHTALERPETKTWDVHVALPGVGASVFCGVGLVVGLLGVAAGTFFLVKGNNCN